MCVLNSPLLALPGIWLAPFFQQKVYEWPDFSGFLCERPLFSDILVYAHIFRLEIFRGCLSSCYYMNWLWYLCNNQQKMGTKNQRAVYEKVNILDDQVYEWVRFFEGQVYEWGRFWNTGSHTRTKITPKLPSPRPLPPQALQKMKSNCLLCFLYKSFSFFIFLLPTELEN